MTVDMEFAVSVFVKKGLEGLYLFDHRWSRLLQHAVSAYALYFRKLRKFISAYSSSTSHTFVDDTAKHLNVRRIHWWSALSAHTNYFSLSPKRNLSLCFSRPYFFSD